MGDAPPPTRPRDFTIAGWTWLPFFAAGALVGVAINGILGIAVFAALSAAGFGVAEYALRRVGTAHRRRLDQWSAERAAERAARFEARVGSLPIFKDRQHG